MHRRSRLLIAGLAAAATLFLGACGGDEEPGGESSLGQTVYTDNCASCHGPDGAGGTGPALGDGAVEENLTLDEQLQVIREGRGGMPAWEGDLSEEEIEAVALFEREELGR